MEETLILLFLAVTGISKETYWTAMAIQGEGAHLLCDTELAGRAIAHTIYNRIEHQWCPDVETCVKGAYWGITNIEYPDEWAITLAQNIGPDPTGDAVYAFSTSDCSSLGLDISQASLVVDGETSSLAFYTRDTQWESASEQVSHTNKERQSVK